MSIPEFITFEELAEAHRKLRLEYERTREIVDKLVEKFEGHVHVYQGSLSGCEMTTETPKKVEPAIREEMPTLFCEGCGQLLKPIEKRFCDNCFSF